MQSVRRLVFRVKTPMVALPKTSSATPVGVVVQMSDGTTQVFPLGVWLEFQNGQLRGVMPTQYIGQICVLQTDGSWLYPKPGRNVQVWRNGLLQRFNLDYTLNTVTGKVIPNPAYPWTSDDLVTVAYLY